MRSMTDEGRAGARMIVAIAAPSPDPRCARATLSRFAGEGRRIMDTRPARQPRS